MQGNELKTGWYLISAEAGMMPTAQVEIVGRGVEFLLPKTWRRALVDGHHKAVPAPLLPGGYAFVRLSMSEKDDQVLNEQAAAVKALRGVREVYKNAMGTYSPVRNWEIQALKDLDASEYREACKTRARVSEPKFPAGCHVRILRHATMQDRIGEFLYSVRGQATLAMDNGIKLPIPDCDIAQVTKGEAIRLAG
jgi:hypothetical protein